MESAVCSAGYSCIAAAEYHLCVCVCVWKANASIHSEHGPRKNTPASRGTARPWTFRHPSKSVRKHRAGTICCFFVQCSQRLFVIKKSLRISGSLFLKSSRKRKRQARKKKRGGTLPSPYLAVHGNAAISRTRTHTHTHLHSRRRWQQTRG